MTEELNAIITDMNIRNHISLFSATSTRRLAALAPVASVALTTPSIPTMAADAGTVRLIHCASLALTTTPNQQLRRQKALLDPNVKAMNGTNTYEQLLDRLTGLTPQPIRSSSKISAANGQDSVDRAIFAACSSERIN